MKHKEKWLEYACQYQIMRAKEWRKVVFSDEKEFNLDSSNDFQKYWYAKIFPEENYWTGYSGRGSLMIWVGVLFIIKKNYNLFVADKKQQILWRCWLINLLHKKGFVYVNKNGFFRQIMLLSTMHQLQRSTCLNKSKTSWPPSVFFRPQSYRKFVGIDCCKSLWRRSTVFSNFWTQKRTPRRMEKYYHYVTTIFLSQANKNCENQTAAYYFDWLGCGIFWCHNVLLFLCVDRLCWLPQEMFLFCLIGKIKYYDHKKFFLRKIYQHVLVTHKTKFLSGITNFRFILFYFCI